jgi:hypothetical protein
MPLYVAVLVMLLSFVMLLMSRLRMLLVIFFG